MPGRLAPNEEGPRTRRGGSGGSDDDDDDNLRCCLDSNGLNSGNGRNSRTEI